VLIIEGLMRQIGIPLCFFLMSLSQRFLVKVYVFGNFPMILVVLSMRSLWGIDASILNSSSGSYSTLTSNYLFRRFTTLEDQFDRSWHSM
jgi:hypothetical protein